MWVGRGRRRPARCGPAFRWRQPKTGTTNGERQHRDCGKDGTSVSWNIPNFTPDMGTSEDESNSLNEIPLAAARGRIEVIPAADSALFSRNKQLGRVRGVPMTHGREPTPFGQLCKQRLGNRLDCAIKEDDVRTARACLQALGQATLHDRCVSSRRSPRTSSDAIPHQIGILLQWR